jgi:hypothetical protein
MKKNLLLIAMVFAVLNAFAQSPTIYFTPDSGPVGTLVTITGTNFDPTPANNIVSFGSARATVLSATSSQITASVPGGVTYDRISVTVASTGYTAVSSTFFHPTFAPITCTTKTDKLEVTMTQSVVNGTITDVDADGQLDIVALNTGYGVFGVFFNRGNRGAVSFNGHYNFITGASPRAVSSADFDGDGKRDLALANLNSGTVSIFKNTGLPEYQVFNDKHDEVTGSSPGDLAIADLDGDGRVDIAVVNTVSSTVSILINTSSPGSLSFVKEDFPTGGTAYTSLVIADMDNDGRNDVVIANNSNITILRNTSSLGDPDFTTKQNFSAGSAVTDLAQGDFDKDGKIDIAMISNSASRLSVFRNISTTGAFSLDVRFDQTTGQNPAAIAIGEINGDGKPDIAIANSTSKTISVFENSSQPGANTFVLTKSHNTITTPTSISIGDLDQDNIPELIYTSSTGYNISVLKFSCVPPTISTATPANYAGSTIGISGNYFGSNPDDNIVLFGSAKGLISSVSGSYISVTVPAGATNERVSVTNKITGLTGYSPKFFTPAFPCGGTITTGTFAARTEVTAAANPNSVAQADFDSDGFSDLVTANSAESSISVFRNTGTGAAEFGSALNYSTGANPRHVSIADINADGKFDIVICNRSGSSVSVFRNTSIKGSLSFVREADCSLNSAVPYATVIGDFDTDGRNDIAVLTSGSSPGVSVIKNLGADGIVAFAPAWMVAYISQPVTIVAGNFNSDSKRDLAVIEWTSPTSYALRVYQNDTQAGGDFRFSLPFSFNTGVGYTAMAAGDIYSAPKDDIVLTNENTNTFTVFRNTTGISAPITFTKEPDFATGTTPVGVLLTDVDGSGVADVVITNKNSGDISVFKNMSNGLGVQFEPKVNFSVGSTPTNTVAGDFNGDGRLDLAAANAGANAISILTNLLTCPAPAITGISPVSGPAGTVVTIQGSNFATNGDSNAVLFGNVRASVIDGTPTSLTVIAPAGAGSQKISVANNQSGLTATSVLSFATTIPCIGTINSNSMAVPVHYANGTGSDAIVHADLNGDGKVDLIAANFQGNSISVFRNVSTSPGTISYATKFDIQAPAGTSAIAVADLTADGRPELIITSYASSEIWVLLNSSNPGGSPAFEKPVSFAAGTNPTAISTGDFDQDGRTDVAVANETSNTVSVLRNLTVNSWISFAPKTDFATANGARYITTDDFNGDSKIDFAVVNSLSNLVSIYQNTSTAPSVISFDRKPDLGTGTTPFNLASGDLDGDGKPDLAVTNSLSNSISLFRNTSSSGISFTSITGLTTGNNPRAIFISDLDGDLKADVAVANYGANSLSLFRNTTSSGITFALSVDFVTTGTPAGITISDWDFDGVNDVAVANGSTGTISLFKNLQVCLPAISSFAPTSGAIGSVVTISGNNFDTAPSGNIVMFGAVRATVISASATQLQVTVPIGAAYGPISVTTSRTGMTVTSTLPFNTTFECSGVINTGSFLSKTENATGASPVYLYAADFNADGKPDLVSVNSSDNSISILKNTGAAGLMSFAAKDDKVTGTLPSEAAIGDLDGDGKPDIAVANYGSGTVSVFQNTSTATVISFAAKYDVTASSGAYSVALGDFDHDGRTDLAIANRTSNKISVFRNLSIPGAISFGNITDFNTAGEPYSIVAADMDNDGKTDLITANYSSNSVSIFRNLSVIGTIDFQLKPDVAAGTNPVTIAAGDINADGKIDVVVGNYGSHNVTVFKNTSTGAGNISVAQDNFEAGNNPHSVAINDIDGDGKVDIAVSNSSSDKVSVLKNITTGAAIAFEPKVEFTSSAGPKGLSLGDLDGDGKPDMAVVNSGANNLSIWMSKTCAVPAISSFTPQSGPVGSSVTITGSNFNPSVSGNVVMLGGARAVVTSASKTQLVATVPAGGSHQPVSVTTIANGMTAYSSQSFITTFNCGSNIKTGFSFGQKADIGTNTQPVGIALGDLDNDGVPDVVVTNQGSNNISIFKNSSAGPGSITFALKTNSNTASGPIDVVVADLDADGKQDVAVANLTSNNVSILRNVTVSGGNPTLAEKRDYNTGTGPRQLALGDVDGDGRPDLLVLNSTGGTISVLKNTSAPGAISFAEKFDIVTNAQTYALAVQDFDGDSKVDIAFITNSSGTVSLIRNTSTSGAITFDGAAVNFSVGRNPYDLASGDFDGDGKNDLAIINETDETVSVLRNISSPGGFAFTPRITYLVRQSPRAISIGDMDGDSKVDILVANYGSANISVLFNNGSPGAASFNQRSVFGAGTNPSGLINGDLDLDGKSDLVATNYGANTITIARNVSGCIITPLAFTPESGPIGTTVTLTGNNFNMDPANNAVYFGAVRAVVSSASATTLTVTVPTGSTYENISVTNLVTGLMVSSQKPFVTTFDCGGGLHTGSFPLQLSLAQVSSPNFYAMADFDGDGLTDIAVTSFTGPGKVSVFRNTGTAGSMQFGSAADFNLVNNSPKSIATADLNGDGKPDIIAGCNGVLSILRNTSSAGTLSFVYTPSSPYAQPSQYIYGIAVGDLDGDGRRDIAAASANGIISIYKNTTTTTGGVISFSLKDDRSVGTYFATESNAIAIGDIDGDGKPEIAAANPTAKAVSVFKNISVPGSITLVPKADYLVSSGPGPNAVALGDLDKDGKVDIAASSFGYPGGMWIYRNTSTAESISFINEEININGVNSNNLSIADADGDSFPDLLFTNRIFRNQSLKGFMSFKSFSISIGSYLSIADMDSDGKGDILSMSTSPAQLSIYKNSINCPVSISSVSPLSGPIGTTVTITGSNFNPVAANNAIYVGGVKVDATTASKTQVAFVVPAGDSQGKITVTDLATGSSAQARENFKTTFPCTCGCSVVADSYGAHITAAVTAIPNSVVNADFDGDGKLDFAVGNSGTTGVSIFRNTGSGSSVSFTIQNFCVVHYPKLQWRYHNRYQGNSCC